MSDRQSQPSPAGGVAVVPVGALDRGKSRLRRDIGATATERLTLAMLADVIGALRGVPELSRVVVVTPDPRVGELATAEGAEAWVRADDGLNPALERAGAELVDQGAAAVLTMLGDVAGARSEEISRLFAALAGIGGRGAVIAPSRDGGTAALLRAPADLIGCRFGKESAEAHRALARSAGIPWAELPLPSLAIDVDRIEDARGLLAVAEGATRTRRLLRELGLGDAA